MDTIEILSVLVMVRIMSIEMEGNRNDKNSAVSACKVDCNVVC